MYVETKMIMMMMMKVMLTSCNFQNRTSLVFPPSLLRRQSWSRIFWQLLIVVVAGGVVGGVGGGGVVARLCIFYFQPVVIGRWEGEGCQPLLGLPCWEESEGIFFGRGVSQVDLWPSFWITLFSFSLFCVWKFIELFQIWTSSQVAKPLLSAPLSSVSGSKSSALLKVPPTWWLGKSGAINSCSMFESGYCRWQVTQVAQVTQGVAQTSPFLLRLSPGSPATGIRSLSALETTWTP